MLSIQQLYLQGKKQLIASGCESSAFDAAQLIEVVFGFDRQQMLLYGNRECTVSEEKTFRCLIQRRAEGYPLQYLLQKWPFFGRLFYIGEGVLIPREETELLVQEAIEFCGDRVCSVLDLCAGSGAIGVTCACECAGANVTCVELSEKAIEYLQKNNETLCNGRVHVLQGDICTSECAAQCPIADVILSNPPYIPSNDLPGLQREVQFEPVMALDGGADGVLFYRAILQLWLSKLKLGGLLAVECGIGQSNDLAALFAANGLKNIRVINDFNGIGRVVRGEK